MLSMGGVPPFKPRCFFGWGESPPDPPHRKQGALDSLCAQARIARTTREHEARLARNMISNHTDIYDYYCGDCYDIRPIQSQYTKEAPVGRHHKRGGAAFGCATSFVVSFVSALNRVNIAAITTIIYGP